MKALRIITVLLFVLSLALYLGVSFRYEVVLDRVSPQIQCESEILEVGVHATDAELLAGVTAQDNRDGDLTDQIMIQGISRLLTDNTARITYAVADSSGNLDSCTRTLQYVDYENPRLMLTEMPVYRTYPAGDAMAELSAALSAWDVRDGDVSKNIVIVNQASNDGIEGEFRVTLQIINSMGGSEVVPLTVVIDNEGAENPMVTLREYITYVSVGTSFDPLNYVSTVNGVNFEGSYPALRVHSDVDTAVPGVYQVRYQYMDFAVYLAVVVR